MKNLYTLILTLCALLAASVAQAQVAPSDTMGGIISQQLDRERAEEMEKRITTERELDEGEAKKEDIIKDEGPKVMIRRISVKDATLFTYEALREVTSKYEGQELTFGQVQGIAQEITDLYRSNGYVTSRAYVPPQSLEDGVLVLNLVEGKVGSLEIRGNEHFSTELLEKKLKIKDAEHFDYKELQKNMAKINEHPDRTAKVTLAPGQEPGTTDVTVDVEDQMPIHVGFIYDNYASRYLEKDRYAVTLEHNNLFGLDDKLFLKLQTSQSDHLRLAQGRYSVPVGDTWEVGGHFLYSESDLGREFEDLDAHGKAEILGLFGTKELVETEIFELRWNVGFDYKDIRNHLLGSQTSRDTLSVARTGLDFDIEDKWGRTVITTEYHYGIEDFLGAMDKKDSDASRVGAGGRFQKGVIHAFRLQPMPFPEESYILWKNSAQLSNHTLAASEQFQIGGPHSVRGYAPAEKSGDKGYYTGIEWSFPFYGMPKDWKVPFREKETLYQSLRLVTFYDLGWVHLNNPQAGEEESETLKGYGVGVRLNVAQDLEARVEVGWPLDGRSSDGDREHVWLEFRKKF